MDIQQMGATDIYLKKFDQHISISKPRILANNLIFGGMYIDVIGEMVALNHQTKEKVVLTFFEKQSDEKTSYIEGKIYDPSGKLVGELSGSWLTSIHFKPLSTGRIETLWSEPELVENAHLQFYYMPITVLMNYCSPEMEGFVSPTDTRWRKDLRCYEEGRIDEAEQEKMVIEKG